MISAELWLHPIFWMSMMSAFRNSTCWMGQTNTINIDTLELNSRACPSLAGAQHVPHLYMVRGVCFTFHCLLHPSHFHYELLLDSIFVPPCYFCAIPHIAALVFSICICWHTQTYNFIHKKPLYIYMKPFLSSSVMFSLESRYDFPQCSPPVCFL